MRPTSTGSHSGPAFAVEVAHGLAKALSITWKCLSSGKAECTNQALKQALSKFCPETQLLWTPVLLLVLLNEMLTLNRNQGLTL